MSRSFRGRTFSLLSLLLCAIISGVHIGCSHSHLVLKVTFARRGDEVEGGEAAGQAGLVLEAAIRRTV